MRYYNTYVGFTGTYTVVISSWKLNEDQERVDQINETTQTNDFSQVPKIIEDFYNKNKDI